ncbi:RpiB/LacA/LacB family sugar-phosphate isomerase [Candidatus Woesearchaeota archaeon]|nr:RpiB/LacA/LacB family sugar-phosphate isomerase [Candidatus Woesearchaeota archaeon]
MKKIYLGSDHAGFKLKEKLKKWLTKQKIPFEDLGNKIYDSKDDYPDFAKKVAKAVVKNKTKGILLCGSAQGMSIAANKMKGVRAAIPFSVKEAKLSREHNDANIICLSGWYSRFTLATKMLKIFLNTSFSKAPRHKRRLNKVKKLR